MAGCTPAWYCEQNPACCSILRLNFPLLKGSPLSELRYKTIPNPEVICGSIYPSDRTEAQILGLISIIQPRMLAFEWPTHRRDKPAMEFMNELSDKYFVWERVLSWAEFGVPQDRNRLYIVGFRRDIRLKFIAFPFPEGPGVPAPCGPLLDQNPSPSLSVASIRRPSGAKFGFETKMVDPSRPFPTIPSNYHKGEHSVLVAGPQPRRLSPQECKRAMGFGPEYVLPQQVLAAYHVCMGASPIVAKAIFEELKVWR